MGSFIEDYGKVYIPEKFTEECNARMEELFWRGGMMKYGEAMLYGIKIGTLSRGYITKDSDYHGIYFNYNYFEDTFWEDAGYNADRKEVFSNKLGWSAFAKTMYAAYVLEGIYSDIPIVPLYNNEMLNRKSYIRWINFLFNEHYSLKQPDSWDYFEYLHKNMPEMEQNEKWLKNIWHYSAYDDGIFCTYAVLNGVQNALEHIEDYRGKPVKEDGLEITTLSKKQFQQLSAFREESNIPVEQQVDCLIEHVKKIYTQKGYFNDISSESKLAEILITVVLMNNPAITVKCIAEIYDTDFWNIWDEIQDAYNHTFWGSQEENNEEITTSDFFHCECEDMLPYWEENDNIEFSEELKVWFSSLKSSYDTIIDNYQDRFYSLRDIFLLLKSANDEFRKIYVFEDFLNATIESVSDKKYQTLWKIFDNLLQNARQEENKDSGRKILRRFLAICGNESLREKVFGF